MRARRRIGAALAVAALLAPAASVAAESLPPPPARWLTDEAGVLSSAAAAGIDRRLEAFEREQGTQLLVVLLRSLPADAALEDWTQRVAESWRVGRREHDDGAVLFVFVDDRSLRLEVGYGLEGALTDLESKAILDEVLVPRLRAGDWDGGVAAAAEAMIAAVRGEYRPDPASRQEASRQAAPSMLFFFVLLAAFLLLSAFASRRNRGRSRMGGRGGWGGWGGGGGFRGGGFGGGGFGGGGFSGGGGSFGGGGASGRW